MSISFSGLASGLDTSSWITSLTALKQAKVTTLQKEKENIISAQETLSGIKSYFSSFRSKIEKITDAKFNIASMDIFAKKKAVSSTPSVVSASVTSAAQEGTYQVKVDRLASNTQVKSSYRTTSQETVRSQATTSSILKDFGVSSGDLTVIKQDGVGVTVSLDRNETINSLLQKFSDKGIEASFSNTTGAFSFNTGIADIIDIGNTHFPDAVHLVGVTHGYINTSPLQTEEVHEEYHTATESTKLSALGVSVGHETDRITVCTANNEFEFILDEDETIGSLKAALIEQGIDARFADGVFELHNAYIDATRDTTGICEIFGLSAPYVNSSSGASDEKMTTTNVTAVADEYTKFGQLGLSEDTVITFDKGGYENVLVTIGANTTIGEFLSDLGTKGVAGSISNGIISIDAILGEAVGDTETISNIFHIEGAESQIIGSNELYVIPSEAASDPNYVPESWENGSITYTAGQAITSSERLTYVGTEVNTAYDYIGDSVVGDTLTYITTTTTTTEGTVTTNVSVTGDNMYNYTVTTTGTDFTGAAIEGTVTAGISQTGSTVNSPTDTIITGNTQVSGGLSILVTGTVAATQTSNQLQYVVTTTASKTQTSGTLQYSYATTTSKAQTGALITYNTTNVVQTGVDTISATRTVQKTSCIGTLPGGNYGNMWTIKLGATCPTTNQTDWSFSPNTIGETTYVKLSGGTLTSTKTLTFTPNSTLSDVKNALAEYGFNMSLSTEYSHIKVTLTRSILPAAYDENGYPIDDLHISSAGNAFKKALGFSTSFSFCEEQECNAYPPHYETQTIQQTATSDTNIYQALGLSGNNYIYTNGGTITVNNSTTFGQLVNALKNNTNKVNAEFTNGRLNILAETGYYTGEITGGSSQLLNALGIHVGNGQSYTTGTATATANGAKTLQQVGVKPDNTITVSTQDGRTATIASSDTIDTLLSKFNNIGITSTFSNGVFQVAGGSANYITSITETDYGVNSFQSTFNISAATANATQTDTYTTIVTNDTAGKITLNDVGLNTNNNTAIFFGGSVVINMTSDMTVEKLVNDLNTATGGYASLNNNGQIVLEAGATNYIINIGANAANFLGFHANQTTAGNYSYATAPGSTKFRDVFTTPCDVEITINGDEFIYTSSFTFDLSNGEHVTFNTQTTTINGLISDFNSKGFNASYNSSTGQITFNNTSDVYITDVSTIQGDYEDQLRYFLNILAGSADSTNDSVTFATFTPSYTVSTVDVDPTTATLSKLGLSGPDAIVVVRNSFDYNDYTTVSVSASTTFDDFASQLASAGVNLSMTTTASTFTAAISTDNGKYVYDMSQNLKMLFGFNTGDGISYEETGVNATADTTLAQLGIQSYDPGTTSHSVTLMVNGTEHTLNFTNDASMQDIADSINAYAPNLASIGTTHVNQTEPGFINVVQQRDTSTMIQMGTVDSSTSLTEGVYAISTAEDLAKLAAMTNAGKVGASCEFVLANNIDLSGYDDWTAIGQATYANTFRSTFDGNGYVISNLKTTGMGLFGYVRNGAVIKNLGIEDANITGSSVQKGILAGYVYSSDASYIININNCYATGNIINNHSGIPNTGSLIGTGYKVTISNSYTDADITATSGRAGKLCGYNLNNGVKITNSYGAGTVTGGATVNALGTQVDSIGDIPFNRSVLTLSANENAYITGMSDTLASLFGVDADMGKTYDVSTDTVKASATSTLRELGFVGTSSTTTKLTGATSSSTLGNYGVEGGYIRTTEGAVSFNDTTTFSELQSALSDIGVTMSLVNNTLSVSGTNIVEVQSRMTNQGYTNSLFGLSAASTSGVITTGVKDSDYKVNITVTSNSTIQDVINALDTAGLAVDQTQLNNLGKLKITAKPGSNAYIESVSSDALADALGLNDRIGQGLSYNSELTTIVTGTVESVVTADTDTTMAELGLAEGSYVTSCLVGKINGSGDWYFLTITQNTTLGSIVDWFNSKGLDAELDSSGKININPGTNGQHLRRMNGNMTAMSILGLDDEIGEYKSYHTENPHPVTTHPTQTASGNTALSTLGLSEDGTITLADGSTINISTSDTLNSLLGKLNSNNITASLDNGYLTIGSADDVNAVIDMSDNLQSVLKYEYSVDFANGDSYNVINSTSITANMTFGMLGFDFGGESEYLIHDIGGHVIGTITSDTTVGEFLDDWSREYSIIDGQITVNGAQMYLDDLKPAFEALGFNVDEIINNTTLGSIQNKYGDNIAIRGKDLKIVDSEDNTITEIDLSLFKPGITSAADMTLGEFKDALSHYGIDVIYKNGSMTIDTNGDYVLKDATGSSILSALGIDTSDAAPVGTKGYKALQNKFINAVESRDTSSMTQMSAVDSSTSISDGVFAISTVEDLQKLATMVSSGKVGTNCEFVLANDIDLSDIENWTSIGTASCTFKSTFDGNGYTISGLTQTTAPGTEGNRLFGLIGETSTGAIIKNLAIEDSNIEFTKGRGGFLVGKVVGSITIDNCYVDNSSISCSNGYVGGLIGEQISTSAITIKDSYTDITVSASPNGGALVGFASSTANISTTNAYYLGSGTQSNSIGEQVNSTEGIIENAQIVRSLTYNKVVDTEFTTSAKLVNLIDTTGHTDYVTQTSPTLTLKTGTVTLSNDNTSNKILGVSQEGNVLTREHGINSIRQTDTSEMRVLSASEIRGSGDTGTYAISSVADLMALHNNVMAGNDLSGCTFVLANDIDLTEIYNRSDEFSIGSSGSTQRSFTGTFDGNGYEITGLNNSEHGLFASLNGATITNLSVKDAEISGEGISVGIIANYAQNSTIQNCYTSGNITGEGDIGGLIGETGRDVYINQTYSDANVSGMENVGGLVGACIGGFGITVENSATTGTITAIIPDDAEENYTPSGIGRIIGSSDGELSLRSCLSSSEIVNAEENVRMEALYSIADSADNIYMADSTTTIYELYAASTGYKSIDRKLYISTADGYIDITSDTTIDELVHLLQRSDIRAAYTNGKIVIGDPSESGIDNYNRAGSNYITDISSELSALLGIEAGEGISYIQPNGSTDSVVSPNTDSGTICRQQTIFLQDNYGQAYDTRNTSVYQLLRDKGGDITIDPLNPSQYHIELTDATTGSVREININYDDTIDDVLSALENAGISINGDTISGKLQIGRNATDLYISGISEELQTAFGIGAGEGISYYSPSGTTKYYDETVTDTQNTTLDDLGYNHSTIHLNTGTNVSLSHSDSIDSVVSKLNTAGLTASFNNGQLSITGGNGVYIDSIESGLLNGNNSNDLFGITGGGEGKSFITTNGQNLGITEGIYDIISNGEHYTGTVTTETTVQDIVSHLATYGITVDVDSTDGSMSFTSADNTYLTTENEEEDGYSNVISKLFGNVTNLFTVESDEMNLTEDVTTLVDATLDTLVSTWDSEDSLSQGTLAFSIGGEDKTITITSTETMGGLLYKLQSQGVDTFFENGVLKLGTGSEGFVIDTENSTSKLVDNLNLELDDNYSQSSAPVMQEVVNDVTNYLSVANYAMDSTMLATTGITAGSLSVFRNGVKQIIQIDSEDTFDDLHRKLNDAFETGDVRCYVTDGKLRIYSAEENVQVLAGAIGDTSNILSVCGLQAGENNDVVSSRQLYNVNKDSLVMTAGAFRNGDVTEGSFVIGDATINIDSTTTISNLIAQINSSEETGANAYWDSIDGKLVINSRLSGASIINVEAGTSNFTDIMGLTTTERDEHNNILSTKLNSDTQKLGSNAKFSINGTEFTAVSNTITSDISRVQGLTLNLKNVSSKPVDISITKDVESIQGAIEDFVESYNELVESIDVELAAANPAFEDKFSLRQLRNQIRSLMTGSYGGLSTIKSLTTIGVTTQNAMGSSIATTGLERLYLDSEKFYQKYMQGPDDVKSFLVGSDDDPGILIQIESIVENALSTGAGYFASAEKSYMRKIENLNNKITKANQAVETYRARLESKFQSMDMLISGMQNQYKSFLSNNNS